MKLKYSISYFILVTSMIVAFIYTYIIATTHEVEGYVALEESPEEEIIFSNSDDILTTGYYLKEHDGYVAVYLFDQVTVYEETDILVGSLPETLQKELADGKYVETSEELYAFLENYSS